MKKNFIGKYTGKTIEVDTSDEAFKNFGTKLRCGDQIINLCQKKGVVVGISKNEHPPSSELLCVSFDNDGNNKITLFNLKDSKSFMIIKPSN